MGPETDCRCCCDCTSDLVKRADSGLEG